MTEGKNGMRSNAIIGLLAQTSIHAGSGQNTGVIDLSIQREGHNGWPCIFGSAVKGAVRTLAEDKKMGESLIDSIFGSEANNNQANAGAVAFCDARLLLFPVRSLTSQFKWVTCPAALRRYQNDAARVGLAIDCAIPAVTWSEELALVAEAPANNRLFLEEYRFNTQQHGLSQTIKVLRELMPEQGADNLNKQLVIVSDDMFSFIVQHATPVNAHIAIDSETKTAKPSALWYEETLPPETLLYFTLSAAGARKKDEKLDAKSIRAEVFRLFSGESGAWLQVGGNETVGMGWCVVSIKQ
jgi:CRISPR-associated protein Cmr4